MKIDIWSDYVCPFCYIGKRRIEEAIKRTGFEKTTDLDFKAFQLDPDAPAVSGETVREGLAKKYGMSEEEVRKMTDNTTDLAKSTDLHFDYDAMVTVNTFDAHRLSKWAAIRRKRKEFDEYVFKSYFTEGRKIGVEEVLVSMADEIGLPKYEAEKVLRSDQFKEEVLEDIRQAKQLGINSVPYYVINGKYSISGAQPVEVFEEALRKVAEEEGLTPVLEPIVESEPDGACNTKQSG
ncbi:DsbA family oxidoreductase [Indiicoccus explosivorum]|uniref:DsbA family oxidoreductase n=1 Tax=Indiicoccus explosivorum TaxID=1917864 RepID=UPI000B43A272|nr:DsbA family oxidoreductase [Indiicoccus explosivorum]